MMIETVMSRSVRLICAGGLAIGMHAAYAQSAPEPIQRVEITGSSIKRIAAEAALPVQTFSQKDIQRAGITSASDFIQQLPVMQGFTVAADSVGGGGGGITTASIHNVGEQYTLVLVNGRRIAPANAGTTIDINGIPLGAVERIEVLTDGASALYGADAIAGVVNFILKKGAAPLQIDAKYSKPQAPGAKDKSVSISKGFGDLETDGYSVFLAAGHQEQERMKASQRSFAKSGIINFNDPKTGKPVQFFNGSVRSIPPNVDVGYLDAAGEEQTVSFNPYRKLTGKCPPGHVEQANGECSIDYTATVEISPEVKRNNFYASGQVKLGNSGFNAFGNVSYSESHVTAVMAPYPAEFSLEASSPMFSKYISPYLTPDQRANVTYTTVKYRLQDMGGRANDFGSKATTVVAGLDGEALGWSVNGAFTYSSNKSPSDYTGGYPLADKFNDALSSGAVDPFPYALGEMPQAMIDKLRGTQYIGNYSNTDIKMKGFDVHGSRELFDMPAGKAQLGIGLDYRTTSYAQSGNPAVSHAEILFDDPQPSFDYKRSNSGAFAELQVPVIKDLELTGSLRRDRVSKLTDKLHGGSVGSDQSATTYKLSARYQPTKSVMLRAAYGTGFRTATMLEIGQPQADFGVTGGSYECPFKGALASNPLAKLCSGVPNQLEVFKGGNADLKPEKSKQWSFGAVFEPNASFSAKLDVWNVEIRDGVNAVDEALIAGDAAKYLSLYTTKFKASTGRNALAIILAPINIGRAENRGIDYDFLYRTKLADGKLTGRLAGTYLLQSRHTIPGTDDQWDVNMNAYGKDTKVAFRNVIQASASYELGAFTHNLKANYRNGYKDIHHEAKNRAVRTNDLARTPVDIQLEVPSYTTFDWQTQYRMMKNLELNLGINNVTDRNPPLSLRNAGSHQLGYDPRYASAVGRTFYLSGSYKF
ncbi:TonB-dependent receptor [Janthinobacterium sp. BJB412]|nr:TonB-dependent receptor [Janthinobacterium sp. BJB412]